MLRDGSSGNVLLTAQAWGLRRRHWQLRDHKGAVEGSCLYVQGNRRACCCRAAAYKCGRRVAGGRQAQGDSTPLQLCSFSFLITLRRLASGELVMDVYLRRMLWRFRRHGKGASVEIRLPALLSLPLPYMLPLPLRIACKSAFLAAMRQLLCGGRPCGTPAAT